MNRAFVREMIQCISPSGREAALQKKIYEHYREVFEEFQVDEQGTLTGVINQEASFKIQLAGHADEISLVVTGYESDGSLKVDKNGGIRTKLYVGSKVQILTPDGILKGVVGTNGSIDKKETVDVKDLFIDLGCQDDKEAKALVPLGSYIIHDTDMTELQNGRFAARAFDDRIGVYIIFEAAKRAKELGAGSGIYATATTGEETTGRGAYFSASRIRPNVCVAVDVTYATDYKDPGEPGDIKLGQGGVICRGSIPNPRLNELLEKCAEKLQLPVQHEVFAGRTFTDADTMLKTSSGIPQVLFSIPLRYMHSPVEVLDEKDVDSMIEILAQFLAELKEEYSLLPYSLE